MCGMPNPSQILVDIFYRPGLEVWRANANASCSMQRRQAGGQALCSIGCIAASPPAKKRAASRIGEAPN
jgi:hypothetical protein